jgi:hypothetical protein
LLIVLDSVAPWRPRPAAADPDGRNAVPNRVSRTVAQLRPGGAVLALLPVAVVLVAMTVCPARGDAPTAAPAAQITAAAVPYGPGEELVFSVNYGPVNAGEATLAVLSVLEFSGRNCYAIESRTTSNSFFSAFYKVRDKVISYIDVEQLTSRYFYKRLREGDYRNTVEITFDQEQSKALYADGREFATVPGVHDVLSAFYYVRSLDLRVGDVYALPAHASRETYDLEVLVLDTETVTVPAGTFTCFVVEPRLVGEGLFKHEGKLVVYVTADVHKIPVLMKSKVPVGSIDATLERYRLGRPLRPSGKGAADE